MQLTIRTPDTTLFEGTVEHVTLPGSAGTFQVLQNHAPLVSTLQKGRVQYRTAQQTHALAIAAGVVEVWANHISVLVDAAPTL